MICVQPYGGVVLGRRVGVEPLIANLHDRSVADSAAFVHAPSIGATGWRHPAERSGRGRPIPALCLLAVRQLWQAVVAPKLFLAKALELCSETISGSHCLPIRPGPQEHEFRSGPWPGDYRRCITIR